MKLSRRLLKKITFICLALMTALLLVVLDSASIAQVNRTPGGEIFPDPVSLGGTWLLPVQTANAQLAKPIVANPDVATVPYEESRSIPVLSNDLGEGLTIIEVGQSEYGTGRINPDGTITYRSVIGFQGIDRFSYTIRDRYGRTATGVVFIDISFV